MEKIPKDTLICEYAGGILPTINESIFDWEDCNMTYVYGSTCSEELVIAPFNCFSYGPLLNHAKKGNCKSLKVVIDGKIRILIYTTKMIKADNELLYNYNGEMEEYDTEGFEDYTAQH